MIRATYELEPPGSAEALALMESAGMASGPHFVRARVVSDEGGRAVVGFPVGNWGADATMLVSAIVAGEVTETAAITRCRLVDLDVPDGLFPGPAFGGERRIEVGVIVKPSLGLAPSEVAAVAEAAIAGGATFVKDDELLANPTWCPFDERVRAVAKVLPPSGVTYCANVSGPVTGLLDRARLAVGLGATGLMVNAVAQGLDSVLALRQAGLGVPILVHRAGSGPWCRNESFGPTGAVLTRLCRLLGADFVIAGAFGGKLFETADQLRANIAAAHEPLGSARPSWALLGGGIGPDNAASQVAAASGPGAGGLLLVLGSRAHEAPGGIEASVRAVREAVGVAP